MADEVTRVCDEMTVMQGDCLDVLPTLDADSIDAIVTDPPYGIGFMCAKWDALPPGVDVFRECLRVLKPGGHLLAFGGTRTYHRLAVAIEDAGFELRNIIAWIYGSGFPKSQDVGKAIDKAAGELKHEGRNMRIDNGEGTASYRATISPELYVRPPLVTDAAKQWDGWGSSLNPAHEPIAVARKPLCGTIAENVLEWGTGALNVDGCRVDSNGDQLNGGRVSSKSEGWDRPWKYDVDAVAECHKRGQKAVAKAEALGRFPANLIHDGSDEVVRLFPETSSGNLSPHHKRGEQCHVYGKSNGAPPSQDFGGDSGSAARFFYCAKADASERGDSRHPTVKPLALMKYLVRLVTPPNGIVLDPFTGSGTTLVAAYREGFSAVGIEQSREYYADAVKRCQGELDRHPLLQQKQGP